jgi:hypothetical protein
VLLATDVWSDVSAVGGALGAVAVGWLGTALVRRWRGRRGRDADNEQEARDVTTALAGETPTRMNPHPAPGLLARMTTAEETITSHGMILESLQESMTTLTAKATPNGGNTRELGDLVLLIAQHLGIQIPEKGHED